MDDSGFTIRPVSELDIPALFEVRTATRENALSLEELAQLGVTKENVATFLRTTHCGWLCVVGGCVVGFAMGNLYSGEMWVIAVLPEWEGHGIGAELLTRVEDSLWAAGWDEIWLTTDVDDSLRAYGFYINQGWYDHEVTGGMRYMQKHNPEK